MSMSITLTFIFQIVSILPDSLESRMIFNYKKIKNNM